MAGQKFKIDDSSQLAPGTELSKMEVVGRRDKLIILKDSNGKMLYCDVQQILDLIVERSVDSEEEGKQVAQQEQELTYSDDGQLSISSGNTVDIDNVRTSILNGDDAMNGTLFSFLRPFTFGNAQSGWPFGLGAGIQLERRSTDTNRSGFRIFIQHNSNDTNLLYQKKLSGDLTSWGPLHEIMSTDSDQEITGIKTFTQLRYTQNAMGGNTVIDFATGGNKTKNIAVNTTFTFTNAVNGAWCMVQITNTDTIQHTVTFTGANMSAASDGIIPASTYAIFSFVQIGGIISGVQTTFAS